MRGPSDPDVSAPAASGARVLRFEPVPASSLQVRNFVAAFTVQQGLAHLVDDVALCATELATNAILHTRDHFVVTVRPAGSGIRLDVLDADPDQLPMMTPHGGSAIDLTTFGNSGRGLQIVAALAARWGVFATDDSKTVWAEITGAPSQGSPDPIVIRRQTRPSPHAIVRLRFLSLPVRAAVASGIQVEDVMRDIQLEPLKPAPHDVKVQRLFELLDQSASIRLAGRHGALKAAAEGRARFDLEINTSLNALHALDELSNLLIDVGTMVSIAVPPLQDDVIEFRQWLNQESERQRQGQQPSLCTLSA